MQMVNFCRLSHILVLSYVMYIMQVLCTMTTAFTVVDIKVCVYHIYTLVNLYIHEMYMQYVSYCKPKRLRDIMYL